MAQEDNRQERYYCMDICNWLCYKYCCLNINSSATFCWSVIKLYMYFISLHVSLWIFDVLTDFIQKYIRYRGATIRSNQIRIWNICGFFQTLFRCYGVYWTTNYIWAISNESSCSICQTADQTNCISHKLLAWDVSKSIKFFIWLWPSSRCVPAPDWLSFLLPTLKRRHLQTLRKFCFVNFCACSMKAKLLFIIGFPI